MRVEGAATSAHTFSRIWDIARALRHVLQFGDDNPDWSRYMRSCLNPDETYFTTIVANAAELMIENDVRRFIRWPRGVSHASSGAVITADEIPQVLQSTAPFALKLDSRVDAQALDLLDEHLRPHMAPAADAQARN